MAQFALIAELQVKPDSVERFIPMILANAAASVKTEPGCLQFDVTQQVDEPTKFTLYEVYADIAAFESHGQQKHVEEFFAKTKDMLANRGARRSTRLAGFHKH